MKKILVLAAVAAAMLTGCKEVSDFNKYLTEDYAFVQGEYEGHEVVFYEAEVTLNGTPVELGKKAQPVSVKEVFQLTDTALVVFVNRNYVDGTVEVEQHEGYWLEDVAFDPNGLADYNDALNTLLTAKSVQVPNSVFMTLRNPLGPVPYENAFYIFGSTDTNFVAIDAVTLEINSFDVVESRFDTEKPVEE